MKEIQELELLSFNSDAVEAIAAGASLQEVIDLAFQRFGIPLIVVDVSYQMLVCSGREGFVDLGWQLLLERGGAPAEHIVNFYIRDGMLEAISGADGAILVDWGICRAYPQTSGPIYVGGNLEGFVSVLFMDKVSLTSALILNKLLCRLCAILMRAGGFPLKATKNPVFEMLAQKIFDTVHFQKAPDPADYRPYVDVAPGYVMAVIAQKVEHGGILAHVKGRVLSVCSGVLYAIREDRLYLLFYGLPAGGISGIEKNLLKILQDYDMCCGCSQDFGSLEGREAYIEQATLALEAGSRMYPLEKLFHFGELYADCLLLEAADKWQEKNILLPEIRLLEEFDKHNGADYLETLRVYLYERNDLNRAAARLHLHRNTLTYRLRKIEELIGSGFHEADGAWRLQIGLAAWGMRTGPA